MSFRIVYKNQDGGMSILIPVNCGLTIEQIGVKDVPTGIPFWIIPATDIPSDRTFRDAWELDVEALGKPAGFGGTK